MLRVCCLNTYRRTLPIFVRYCPIILMLLLTMRATASERSYRVFDRSNGLPVSSLSGFAQDSEGFFWLGTAAGLYRFDGREFRHWAKDKIVGWFYQIYAGPNGEVLVTCLPDGRIFRVLPNEDAEVVMGPNGIPFSNISDAAFVDDRLWLAQPHAIFYRNERSQWVTMPPDVFENERIWRLRSGPDGRLWVATAHGVWSVDPDLSCHKRRKDFQRNS
jgi:ligand-binding sensor domain-containing protein